MIYFIRTIQQAVVGIVAVVVTLSAVTTLRTSTQGNLLTDISTLILNDDDEEDRSSSKREEDDHENENQETENEDVRDGKNSSSSSQRTLDVLKIALPIISSSSSKKTESTNQTTLIQVDVSSPAVTTDVSTTSASDTFYTDVSKKEQERLQEEQKKLQEELRKLQEKTVQETLKAPATSGAKSSSNSFEQKEGNSGSNHGAAPEPIRFTTDIVEEEATKYVTPTNEDERFGCFTPDGVWTGQRHRCAADQSTIISTIVRENRTVNDIPETVRTVIRQKTETPFVEENSVIVDTLSDTKLRERFANKIEQVRSQERLELAQNVKDLRERLHAIIKYRKLPDESAEFIDRNINWLKDAETIVRTKQFNQNEITSATKSVRMIAENVAVVMQNVQNTPGYESAQTQPIENIVSKTETLLKKISVAFAILEEEGSPVSKTTREAYDKALSRFRLIQGTCSTRKNECNKLDDVFALLEQVRDPLLSAHAKDPSLETKVEQRIR